MNYIQRIRDLREDADRTQTQIAEYLGTSQTMYARYERGANEMPIRHLIALCQYLAQCEFKLPYHLDITDEQPQKMHTDANRKNKMIEHQKIRESHSWLREESQKMMQWLQVNTKNEQVCLYMDLEPEISFQGSLLLSARIGYPGNKQYIIRDLSRFLQEVNIGAYIWKKHTDPSSHRFL